MRKTPYFITELWFFKISLKPKIMYAPRHGNEARSMLVLATSVILLVTLRVEGSEDFFLAFA